MPITISLKFVPKGPINNIPALVQIMAWRRPGDKPLSAPMMIRLPTQICVTRPQWVKAETKCHLTDAIFKFIFLNVDNWISINISLKSVPNGQINNISALVQIMAWCRPGSKPLSKPMMVSLLAHIWVTRLQLVKPLHGQLLYCWYPSIHIFDIFLAFLWAAQIYFIQCHSIVFQKGPPWLVVCAMYHQKLCNWCKQHDVR